MTKLSNLYLKKGIDMKSFIMDNVNNATNNDKDNIENLNINDLKNILSCILQITQSIQKQNEKILKHLKQSTKCLKQLKEINDKLGNDWT